MAGMEKSNISSSAPCCLSADTFCLSDTAFELSTEVNQWRAHWARAPIYNAPGDCSSSNPITQICWRFAVDLLADRLYSKSPANQQQIRSVASKCTASLQHFATNGFVYNILTCRNVADKSVVLPASRQHIRWMWFRTDKSTASLQYAGDLLQTCCRQIRCVASKSPASLQQIRVMWFDLK
jgi:hypothetical protein